MPPRKIFPKTCGCGVVETEELRFFRQVCKECERKKRNGNHESAYPSYKKIKERKIKERKIKERSEKQRVLVTKQRSNPEHRYYFIYNDSKNNDRKKGRENDLTKEFIKDKIKDGCSYCGAKNIKMTVDRIDNSIGHLMTNVVACCEDCNYIRKCMPFEAWIIVSKHVKIARQNGLLDNWSGSKRK